MTSNLDCDLRKHLSIFFPQRQIDAVRWLATPVDRALPDFEVLRLSPEKSGRGWLYFTNGARKVKTKLRKRYEFFVCSTVDDPVHIETLSMLVNFHADLRYEIFPGKIVAIGRPWMPSSNLDHLLVSLPYEYGPALEHCGEGSSAIRILWLQPITAAEAKFAEQAGLEQLEQKFEEKRINHWAISRPSVV